jgi:predicted Zn finger-like uncharacterized protein
MLISCPNCGTNFSVPDTALGDKGRTLKCAKCAHKWFQTPLTESTSLGLDEDSFPPPPARPAAAPPRLAAPQPSFDTQPIPEFPAPEFNASAAAARAAAAFNMDLDLDDEPSSPARGAGLTLNLDDSPIPESLTQPPPARRKSSTAGLWAMLVIMMLICAGAGGYLYQDRVVEFWPAADGLLMDAGLRHEKPGAGLELRNAGTPERMVYNDIDVLIVRGVIANISDRARMVPPMKLMLLDKDKHIVQEKTDQPPVTSLEPGGTAGFKIQLQRPDANAIEVNVVFVDPAEVEAK